MIGSAWPQALGRMFTWQGELELLTVARRTVVAFVTLVRLATALAVLLLALTSDDAAVVPIALLVGLMALELPATTVWLWRSTPTDLGLRALATLTFELAVYLGACAASGGATSDALLIFVGLPFLASFVLDPLPMLGIALCAGAGRALLGEDATTLFVLVAIEGGWATTLAVNSTRGRVVFQQRLRGLDATRAALVAQGGTDWVRERVSAELRIDALDTLDAIRHELTGATRSSCAELATRLQVAIDWTRSIVHELHALSGAVTDLHASLDTLARRRAPRADVTLTVDPRVAQAVDEQLVAVVREALGLIAGPATETVRIAVAADGHGAHLDVAAAPPHAIEARTRRLKLGSLSARAGVGEVAAAPTADGRGERVGILLRGLAAPRRTERRVQGREFRETRTFILLARVGLALVVVTVPLIVGGTEPGWAAATAAACAWLLGCAVALQRDRPAWAYLAMLALDCLLLPASFAFAGAEAQTALLPVAIATPAAVAVIFHPLVSAAVTALIAVAVPLLGSAPQPGFAIAIAWGGILAVAEGSARVLVTQHFFASVRRRNRTLRWALEVEDVERRRIAMLLHDEALQLLLVARQELDEAATGRGDALARAADALDEALVHLRRSVTDLAIDEGAAAVRGGLRDALVVIAARRPDGPSPVFDVDPAAEGVHDGLLVQLTRELYANAAKHARAATARIAVSRDDGAIVLDVADDGVGFDLARVEDALHRGHIGLATVRERAATAGGRVWLGDAPGGGARVRVTLPADRRRHPR